MMNINQKTINMKRADLLEALRKNLAVFTAEYAEALADYKVLLVNRLHDALAKAQEATPEEAANVTVKFTAPVDYRSDYTDAIEMLECSADDLIQIDQRSFKAYVKNEWDWTRNFREVSAANKSDPFGAVRI